MSSPHGIVEDVADPFATEDEADEIIHNMKEGAQETLDALSEYKLNIEIVMNDVLEYVEPNVERYRKDKKLLGACQSILSNDDMEEEIMSTNAAEALSNELGISNDSLEERQTNLKQGDIPVLRTMCERLSGGGGKKVKGAIKSFAADLIALCERNRKKVKKLTSMLAERTCQPAKKRSSSTSAESRPAKKRCTSGSGKTKEKHPKPPRPSKVAAKKVPKGNKSSRKPCSVEAVEEAEKALREEKILKSGTERQRAKVKDQREKAKNDARPNDDPEYAYLFERVHGLWKFLLKDNWTHVMPSASSLDQNRYYIRPGCSMEGGELGKDYFLTFGAVIEYLMSEKKQSTYIDKLKGKRSSSEPTPAARDELDTRREETETPNNGMDPQGSVLTTIDGNKSSARAPLVSTVGMDPDGSELSAHRGNERVQSSPSGTPPPALAASLNETSETVARIMEKENAANSMSFTPEMQSARHRLEELKTTAKKAKQAIESADKAAQRMDALKKAGQEARSRLNEKSVTFENTRKDSGGEMVQDGATVAVEAHNDDVEQ